MYTAYVAVTVLAAAANLFAAAGDFVRLDMVAGNAARVGVPESWITILGILKAAGALGLLAGIWVPAIGTAAAAGLIVFFVGAVITHLRARFYAFTFPVGFLTLAVAALVLGWATS